MSIGFDNKKLNSGSTEWFTNDRFGLFIHWGLYALAARHEWVQQREEISQDVYHSYFKHFDPDLYEPEIWAKAAGEAGMKYFVVTTKHHEGFCLWDSKLTDYKSTNTPAGRDLLTPMVESFRSQGFKTGFYHSLIDWHHQHFTIDDLHAMRNHPDRRELNKKRDQKKYIEYLHRQVEELLTEFGKIDVLWFDFSYPKGFQGNWKNWDGKCKDDWDSEKLVELVRKHQPDIILNDRLNLDYGWDVKTPEQFQPREWVKVNGKPVMWEACQTFSGSWGYHRDEESWKSLDQLVQMLIDTVSKGGNLLLNVGPTGRGEFDERALERLRGIGKWMKRHNRSIYGCTEAPEGFVTPQDCRLTFNPKRNRMYVHVFAWPFIHLHLDGFRDKVEYAQLLHDGSQVELGQPTGNSAEFKTYDNNTLRLTLPVKKPNVTVPVIELFLK